MKILRLITSFKGKESQSYQLGSAILDKLKTEYTEIHVRERNLAENEMPHLNGVHFTSFITPPENLSAEQRKALSLSDGAIKELVEADAVIMEVPMYNFTIPSSLKAWIDHVVRAGVTFRYTENGVEGLVKGKKVFLAIASGGVYSEGPMKGYDFTERYLRNILGFIGITDITTFRVEGSAIPGLRDTALPKALESVAAYVSSF